MNSWITRTLRTVWADVRQGKDVELYITIPIVATVIVLNLFDATAQRVVTALTLAVLTLLTVAILKLRRQGDGLQSALTQLGQSTSLAKQFFGPEHDINATIEMIRATQTEIWLWGATLSAHTAFLVPYVEEAIARGVQVRVLLIAPAPSAAMSMAAFRAGHADVQELDRGLADNLYKLRQASFRLDRSKRPAAGVIDVRTVDYLAPYILYAYDPGLPSGGMEIRIADFRGVHDLRPTFTLQATRDKDWFEYFKAQFETVWSAAIPSGSLLHVDQDPAQDPAQRKQL